MNAAAKKWVKALRSKKFKQTVDQLKNGDSFCCLGVACELAKKAGVIKEYKPGSGGLPKAVQDWLGLSTYVGDMTGREYANLTEYNDLEGWSFAKIAKLIESQPKGLFKTKEIR